MAMKFTFAAKQLYSNTGSPVHSPASTGCLLPMMTMSSLSSAQNTIQPVSSPFLAGFRPSRAAPLPRVPLLARWSS